MTKLIHEKQKNRLIPFMKLYRILITTSIQVIIFQLQYVSEKVANFLSTVKKKKKKSYPYLNK